MLGPATNRDFGTGSRLETRPKPQYTTRGSTKESGTQSAMPCRMDELANPLVVGIKATT